MSHQQLTSLIQCRLSQAQETLREAKILLEQSAYRGSINRSYYAMFYAAVGLLGTQGLGTSKHSGVISLLDREFVKKGIISKTLSKSFHRAFDERQASDYGELLQPEQTTAITLFEQATIFVFEIKSQLISMGFKLE